MVLAVTSTAVYWQSHPADSTAYYNLGNALYNQNQLDAAIAAYRQAIRPRPQRCHGLLQSGPSLIPSN